MPELSQAEKDLLLRKHALRMKLRAEFLKKVSNPYNTESGTVFDPALARFQAMRVSQYDHFKPNAKTVRYGMLLVFVPIVLYGWALKSERAGREEKYRTGQVAYKDRDFKFI